MNGSEETTSSAQRRQAMLKLGAVGLLVFAALGFGAWRWQRSRPPADEKLVDIPLDGGGWMRRAGPIAAAPRAPRPDGVQKVGSSYRVRNGDASMYASPLKDGAWQLSFSYQPQRHLSAADAAVLTARYNSQSLALTKEQIAKLEGLGAFNSGMVVSDDDRAKMNGLLEAYLKADDANRAAAENALKTPDDANRAAAENALKTADTNRAAAENALKTALAEVAERSSEPTRAKIQDRVAQVRQILTPEQVAKLTAPPANRRTANRVPRDGPATGPASGGPASRPAVP